MNPAPRNYRPAGGVLHETFATMLQKHPEAFDCIIFPARSSEHNEVMADNHAVGTLLDRDERAQEYEAPVAGRTMIVPSPEAVFAADASGQFESFHSATDAVQMLVSVPGLRTYSLIRWREYISLESEETVDRTVYVTEVRPMGRSLGAGMLYVCRPLLAEGEAPEYAAGEVPDIGEDNGGETFGEVGVL